MFQAYDSQSALREMVGIRGAAPSIRFKESVPGLSVEKEVLHVPANESVYVWGVELFSGGFDCLKVTHYPDGQPPVLIKNGGNEISLLNNRKQISYFSNGVKIIETLPFDDFWNEPFLVNKNDEKIVKSNFFRCFIFESEGYYKFEIDETFNPKYLSPDFLPIDYASDQIYSPGSGNRQGNRAATWSTTKSKSSTPEDYVRSNSSLKREIYLRVISRDKDIVNGSTISRNVFNLSPGLVKYENLPPWTGTNRDANGNPLRVNTLGPWYIAGNNAYYNIDAYYNSNTTTSGAPTIDLNHGWLGRNAVFAPQYTIQGLMNNLLENSYRPYSDYFRQGCRYYNMRNGVIENVNFYGSDFSVVHQFFILPYSYYNDSLNVASSDANVFLNTTRYLPSGSSLTSVSIASGSPAILTSANHGLTAGTPIMFSGGSLPVGISANTIYFVTSSNLTATTFTISATSGGAPINTTGATASSFYYRDFVNIDSIDNLVSYLNNGATFPISSQNALSTPDQYQNNVLVDMRGAVFKNCTFDKYQMNLTHKSMMLDGAVFENCTFIGCGSGYNNSGGILYKNCHFEEISTQGDLSLTWEAGGSCCVMGCTQKYTERGTLFSFHKGGFNDSIWIRHSYHGIDRFQIANEHWVMESCCCGDCATSNRFDNNMFIMNRGSKGPCSIGLYRTNCKLNLMAFNSFEVYSGGSNYFLVNDPSRIFDIECNVFLYNDSVGCGITMQNWCHNNRFINCTFRKIQNFANPWGGYNWVSQDEVDGRNFYTSYGFLNVSGFGQNAPTSNLIINCSMIDYQDDTYTWGAGYSSDNLFRISNINPAVNDSEILSGKNIIYNLRRIIENSADRTHPISSSNPNISNL